MSYRHLVPYGAFLGPKDLDRALAVVAEAASIDGEQPFELPVIERLLDLIPADGAGYYECRRPRLDVYQPEIVIYAAETALWGINWGSDEVRALIGWWPLCDPYRGGGPEYAVRLSDRLPGRERLRNPFWVELMRNSDHEHVMKLWLPAPAGTIRGFWASRASDRRDFSERDRAVLTVLRTHLALVRERWERRHQPVLTLTRREKEILQLLRQGLTNHEIATQLVISAGTVRSHLEHIFEKLNVHTRTAAVACAFGADT